MNDEFNNEEIATYDVIRNRYSTELENHASAIKVGPVLNSVLKLVNKQLNNVPSASTVHNMNVQKQIAEEF